MMPNMMNGQKNPCLIKAANALIFFVFIVFTNVVEAEIRLAAVFTDDMVLQRDLPINIWGSAEKSESISVMLDGKSYQGQANEQGAWLITLPAQQVATNQSIKVVSNHKSDGNVVELNNIAFGDVWLASGQSNMSFSLKQALKKFPQENQLEQYPDVRQFLVPMNYDFKGVLSDFKESSAIDKRTQWQVASSETVGGFSAVAWFFAKDLYQRFNVPIGIINSSVGGTAIDSWMSYQSLKAYPNAQALAYKLRDDDFVMQLKQENIREVSHWLEKNTKNDKGLQQTKWFDADLDDEYWATLKVPGAWEDLGGGFNSGVVWLRKDFHLTKQESEADAQLLLGNIIEADKTYINGIEVGRTPHRYLSRDYYVNKKLLKTGTNNITIRVEVNKGQGGTIIDKPYKLLLNAHLPAKEISLISDWKYKVGTKSKKLPWKLQRRTSLQFKPVGLYNAMIAPLEYMKFSGVIWYQGEGNVNQYQSYTDQFTTMINLWRELFKQPELPFLFVQLANFLKPHQQPVESAWAELRGAQTQVLNTVENTAMALAIDVGEWNDIHPLDKKTVGQRLALGARRLVYAESELSYLSPQVEHASLREGQVIIDFSDINQGLICKGEQLRGFAIAGHDKKFVWATSRLENNQAIVWHDSIKTPKYVRYAWANNPDKANLYSKQGLPATPFSIELPFVAIKTE